MTTIEQSFYYVLMNGLLERPPAGKSKTPYERRESGKIAKLPVILQKNGREIVFSYSGMVDTASPQDLAAARVLTNLDDEIAVMRIVVRRLLSNDPGNIPGLCQALRTLARMLQANRTLTVRRPAVPGTMRSIRRRLKKSLKETA